MRFNGHGNKPPSATKCCDAGLIGGAGAKDRRERLGVLLRIGHTNGKQLHKRLNMFQISKKAFIEAMVRINQEEKNE